MNKQFKRYLRKLKSDVESFWSSGNTLTIAVYRCLNILLWILTTDISRNETISLNEIETAFNLQFLDLLIADADTLKYNEFKLFTLIFYRSLMRSNFSKYVLQPTEKEE